MYIYSIALPFLIQSNICLDFTDKSKIKVCLTGKRAQFKPDITGMTVYTHALFFITATSIDIHFVVVLQIQIAGSLRAGYPTPPPKAPRFQMTAMAAWPGTFPPWS